MPLYTFECSCGKRQDKIFKINECPKETLCSCGGTAKKIIANGNGGIQCDSINDVSWLPSAIDNLQPDGERRLTSRSEYKRYLKEKNIIAAG
jgi:hypothetical protein